MAGILFWKKDNLGIKKKRTFMESFLYYARKILLYFIVFSIMQVLILKFIPPVFTPLMIIRSVETMFKGKSPVFSYQWESYTDISNSAKLAIISSEDQNFPNHFGIDIKEIKKAYYKSKTNRKNNLRGASTISQQVAKNVFLIPVRSFIRKGLEVYYAVLIETIWGKRRILQTYLNIAEMGEGIYGIKAASKIYYKKTPDKLNSYEAAAIASILPNPRKFSIKKPSGYIQKRQQWIRRQMNNLGEKYLEKL